MVSKKASANRRLKPQERLLSLIWRFEVFEVSIPEIKTGMVRSPRATIRLNRSALHADQLMARADEVNLLHATTQPRNVRNWIKDLGFDVCYWDNYARTATTIGNPEDGMNRDKSPWEYVPIRQLGPNENTSCAPILGAPGEKNKKKKPGPNTIRNGSGKNGTRGGHSPGNRSHRWAERKYSGQWQEMKSRERDGNY
jgi:hypothetical protein